MESTVWNPWHGCNKVSPGCYNCYMFAMDEKYGRNPTIVSRNSSFDEPVRKDRFKNYKMDDCQRVYTCITSDFFHEKADKWRAQAWSFIKERQGLEFFIFTKRTDRISYCLPDDWEYGYSNVVLSASCEDMERLDKRMFELFAVPFKKSAIVCEPLLEPLNLTQWLSSGRVSEVIVGGENAPRARMCRYSWVSSCKHQCDKYGVDFSFHQTGSIFEKDGVTYGIPKHSTQIEQARKARLNTGKFVSEGSYYE